MPVNNISAKNTQPSVQPLSPTQEEVARGAATTNAVSDSFGSRPSSRSSTRPGTPSPLASGIQTPTDLAQSTASSNVFGSRFIEVGLPKSRSSSVGSVDVKAQPKAVTIEDEVEATEPNVQLASVVELRPSSPDVKPVSARTSAESVSSERLQKTLTPETTQTDSEPNVKPALKQSRFSAFAAKISGFFSNMSTNFKSTFEKAEALVVEAKSTLIDLGNSLMASIKAMLKTLGAHQD